MYKYIFTILFPLISCCRLHNEISYEYDGILISRIDECGQTTFYYNNSEISTIRVQYSGINDGFSGYLKFYDNGKVMLLSGDGAFHSENTDTTKFEFKRITASQRPAMDKSVYYISLSLRHEKEFNNASVSEIETKYDLDDSEWW